MKKLLYFIITINFYIKRIFNINSEVVEQYGIKKYRIQIYQDKYFFILQINDFSQNSYIKINNSRKR